MRESTVEQYLVDEVALLGGRAYKFNSPARKNVPDRIVMMPGGLLVFVELKQPGKKATKAQAREHDRFRDLGQKVFVLDSKDAVDWFIGELGEMV